MPYECLMNAVNIFKLVNQLVIPGMIYPISATQLPVN